MACIIAVVPTSVTPPVLSTDWSRVLALRLARQGLLERAGPDGLVEVVERLVGLHAQVMSSAELQAAARIDGLRATDVREALWTRRALVRPGHSGRPSTCWRLTISRSS